MNKLLLSLFVVLMISSLFFVFYFYIYLYKQYEIASVNFYKKNERLKQYYRSMKQSARNNIRKDNVTKFINNDSINKKVGYAVLQFIDEYGRVEKTQTIFKKNFSIGREDSNDIVLSEKTVSRRHCLIIYQENKFYICNLSETNPTMLNGIPIDNSPGNSHLLNFGNIIEMAGYSFRFEDISKIKYAH
ncbi:MAG: FHA domain-containing protein [Lachnospiraceae bacterium]|nr:FHA domain-containing protein [Lachnospiraceae bacterium]